MHSQHKKITQIISLSALTLALTACGSSNSQSNELTTPTAQLPSVLIGELTATTATTITVNQHEIPASNAEVEIDGVDGSLSDLKKGMMVEVETNGSHATEIDYDPNFKGPVQVQGNVINIAGVRLTGFDSSMVKDGDLVEVSGYNSAYNRLTVTYQQPISDPQTELEVEGVISALNTQQRTFSLGNILINYQQADVDGPLVNGQFVEVEGFMNGQQLLANEVDAKQHSSFDDDTDSQLAGQVTWLNNDSTLMTINGQWQVSLNAQTRYDDGTVADLAIGRFVEIDALWQQANNRFVAQEIEFGSANDVVNSNSAFSVTGLVTYTQGVATINGIEFILNNQTVFDDDYLVKPFAFSELAIRAENLIKRQVAHPPLNTILRLANLQVDYANHKAEVAGQALSLQPKEFKLLRFLLEHQGKLVTRTLLFEAVWEYHFDPGTNVIDVHIARLRKKLQQFDAGVHIETIRGVGYRLAKEQNYAD
ncbi:winged helix-turn-helix domain-containing protein [Pseudoalteromonas prydzensis]|jgi:hypothetical protein|uniref:winged helix-turn-helix domain-containing protein n=1 Tax=Pseudoalteromonas prydzensis TaxID=182141 RepID=UPI0037046EF3